MLINFILIKSLEFIKFYKPNNNLKIHFHASHFNMLLRVCACVRVCVPFKINQQLIYIDAARLSGALCGCCTNRIAASARASARASFDSHVRRLCAIHVSYVYVYWLCVLLWCDYLENKFILIWVYIVFFVVVALIEIFSHISCAQMAISLLLRLAPAGVGLQSVASTIMKME